MNSLGLRMICAPVGVSSESTNFHCYGDDMQLYVSLKPDETSGLTELQACNSQLSSRPNKSLKTLQLIQNGAPRVLTATSVRGYISPVFTSLHWLHVQSRIWFKILLLTYKGLNDQVPSHLKELLVSYSLKRSLYSQDAGLFVVHGASKHRTGDKGGRHPFFV